MKVKPDKIGQRSREAEKLLAELQTTRRRRRVSVPLDDERSVEVELRILTGRQELEANARAHQMLERYKLEGKSDAAANLVRCQMVESMAASIVVPGTDEQLFADGDELQGALGETTITGLLKVYAELDAEGDLRLGSAALRQQVTEALKKKQWTQLRVIVPQMPLALLRTTADQLLTSLELRSSSTE